MNIRKSSKFLSLILRHKPETVGVELDKNGWVDVDLLLQAMSSAGHTLSRNQLETVVKDNDKQRFVIENNRIRANQGHSISIELGLEAIEPPTTLFHGTASRFLESISREGLKKMSRQHVHLSPDAATAKRVGARHGEPVIFKVKTGSMHAAGFQFYLSKNGVWLVDAVPYKFLTELPLDD